MPDAEKATDPKADLFLDGLVKIVTDLDKGGRNDPEMVVLIGSLADRIVAESSRADWIEMKAMLSENDRSDMIGTLSRQIEESGRKGEIRLAYAMQAVATSLVGAGFDDERITPGIELLDRFIVTAHTFYLRNAPQTPTE